MVKLKFRINLFDAAIIVAIVLAVLIAVFALYSKPNLGGRTILVDIGIIQDGVVSLIAPHVKSDKDIFYSGTKYPVLQDSYQLSKNPINQSDDLTVTVRGPGNIAEGNSIFNGQRIYINQKVELRGDYQVQGYVTGFRYAD